MLLDILQATAFGAIKASLKLAAGYPGGPVTGVLDYLVGLRPNGAHLEWSVDEKTAATTAFGAALSGKRSMVVLKHVGLNVASDTIMNASFSGVQGGFIIVVGGDPGGKVSQNEMDDRYYAPLFQLPLLEPSSPREAYTMTRSAFVISEKYGIPVLLRISSTGLGWKQEVDQEEIRPNSNKGEKSQRVRFEPEHEQRCLGMTILEASRKRHSRLILVEKDPELERFITTTKPKQRQTDDTDSHSIGIITSGAVSRTVHEAVQDVELPVSILTLGRLYPFPEKAVHHFVRSFKTVLVVEEIEPFIEEKINDLGVTIDITIAGKLTGDLPREGSLNEQDIAIALDRIHGNDIPLRPFEKRAEEHIRTFKQLRFAEGCPIKAGHEALQQALRSMEDPICIGDVGVVSWGAVEPFSNLVSVCCMGTSTSVASGLYHAGDSHREIIAVMGDSSFLHSGIQPLINAVYNEARITFLIFDNKKTAETGGQPNPGTGITIEGKATTRISIEALVKACGVSSFFRVDPFDTATSRNTIINATRANQVSVVLLHASCPETCCTDKG
jgi:indolepyruvate ferredoxin oxidoreductase alpha subunit